jgi:hypothetical protein
MMRSAGCGGRSSLFCLLLVATMAPALVSAQRGAPAPASRPGWLPPEQQWDGWMTAAQRATAAGVLGRIEQILLQVPELAAPDGFEIVPQSAGGYRLLGPNDPSCRMRSSATTSG